ncbi:hypothetical protein J6590_086861, partial [Homalodisca vitripennis]
LHEREFIFGRTAKIGFFGVTKECLYTELKSVTVTIPAITSNTTTSVTKVLGVPKAKRSKSLDFGSELEIAQVQILSVTVALLSVQSTLYCIDSPPYSKVHFWIGQLRIILF